MLYKWLLIILFFIASFNSFSQLVFHQETFRGGTTGAGFSTANGSGSGSFNVYVEPGSTIKKAWLFAQRFGEPYPISLSLNSISYTFDNSNTISEFPTFLSNCNKLGIHAIDITNDVNPSTLVYTTSIPQQYNDTVCYGYSAI